MSALSERWRNSPRAFRILLLLLSILLALLCLLAILEFLLPILTQPKLDFSSDNYSVSEDPAAGTATITVTLSSKSKNTVTVSYATSDGTAEAGKDYTATSGTLTFDPDVTSQTFTVPILDDDLAEDDEETVMLSLSNASNATIRRDKATLSIQDNEYPFVDFSHPTYTVHEDAGTATITVTLTAASSRAISVDYATSNGTATAGVDYTTTSGTLNFAPGTTVKTFTVSILADTTEEGDETVNLTLSDPQNARLSPDGNNPAQLTIRDYVPESQVQFSSQTYVTREGAGTTAITVTLTPASDISVTVDYATSDGTATADQDYTPADGTLTFTPGITSQTFTVSVIDDEEFEDDKETVNLTLSNASGAELGAKNPAILAIEDNDGPKLNFSSPEYTVYENKGPAVITVTLSPASDDLTVTVDYSTADGTASKGVDYIATDGTLTFAPGTTAKSFTVAISDDTAFEGHETVMLTLDNDKNASIDRAKATLTILDDEIPPCTIDNVLRNGNFEEGFLPNELGKYWSSFNNGSAKYSFHIDDWKKVVPEGKYTQLIEIKEATEADRYFGIYQTATVVPGEVYTFSMQGLVRTNTGDVEKTSYGYRLQVGFDTDGGQDWRAVKEWTELPWDEQLRIIPEQEVFRFDAYTTTLTAKTDQMTVFVRAWKKWADYGEGDYDVDDIRLVGTSCITPTTPGIPETGEAPLTIWDNVRIWATIALLVLLFGGAIWKFGLKRA